MTATLTGLNVPDFTAPATSDRTIRLTDMKGSCVVLYFYPRDNTPGCTDEGRQFAEHYPAFRKANCEIFGVSRDNLRSHENFKSKMGFPFELLSDEDEQLCNMFGVMKMKNMYGKKVRGIERSTFVIDTAGVVQREWRGIKVPGHAAEVLDFVSAM
ncbi:MAG TPA: peroxiredoxin [Burkholderiales bacterium]|nr:peroxiredoxin [Burkholderiales bacterium]